MQLLKKMMPALLLLAANVMAAESILEFDLRMQRIDRVSQNVMKNIGQKEGGAAAADARDLEQMYAEMEDYFQQRGNSAEAVRISREGRDLAVQMAQFAERQDFDGAFKAAKGLTKECRACHVVYDPL